MQGQQFVTIQPGQTAPVQFVSQGAPPGAQVVSLLPAQMQQQQQRQQQQPPQQPPQQQHQQPPQQHQQPPQQHQQPPQHQQQPPQHQQHQQPPQQQPPQQHQQPPQPMQVAAGGPPQQRSTNSPQIGEDPRNLIVNYIPTPVTDHELRQLFEQYGELESARVICDRITAHPKGYGFVKYKDEAGARCAMENMNGFEIYNKRLKVTMAKGPHCATINNHTQRLQNVVANTPPTVVLANTGPQGAGGPVQYVLVDSNMHPIAAQMPPGGGAGAPGRQMAGAVALPHEQQQVQHALVPQHPVGQPLQMFRVPGANAVALGPNNDPMQRDSCNNFTNLSQYGSMQAGGLSTSGHSQAPLVNSTGQLAAAVAASQQQQGVPPHQQ